MPRRLLAAVVAGTLAVGGLTACRAVPTVAAYVGDARLTNAQVEQLVKDFNADPQSTTARRRQEVVSIFVVLEVSKRLAEDHDISVPPVDQSQVPNLAQALNATGQVVTLQAEAIAASDAIAKLGTPEAPTDADKREVFQNLVDEQVVQPSQYNAVKDQIDSAEMRGALGLRAVLRDALRRYQVTVNPRYNPLALQVPFTIGNVNTFLVLTLSDTPPAVIDAS
jgi:hypothetical protein